jgi:thioredoxin reductase (NADPH)
MGASVGVVGAGNSAGQAAVHLAGVADQVHLYCRGQSLEATMSRYLIDLIEAQPDKILLHTICEPIEIHGEESLSAATFASDSGDLRHELAALFVFVGLQPRTDWLADVVARDERGFVLTGSDLLTRGRRPRDWGLDRDPFLLETSIPGVFAAGDVRHRSVKRIASAVGEGAMAVQFVHEYLASL